MNNASTLTVKKETRRLFTSVRRRLGFKNADELMSLFLKLRTKMAWSKLDMEILAEYGKLPEVNVVSGSTEKECMEKLGLKDAKKLGEFQETGPKIVADVAQKFTETFPEVKAEVRAKKKPRKTEKKGEESEFFQGIEKLKDREL